MQMRRQITRTQLIQGWFVLITTVAAAAVAAGASVTFQAGAFLAALSLIPPVMLRMLWPATAPVTIAQIIHNAEQQR
jgi:hypothetical protein